MRTFILLPLLAACTSLPVDTSSADRALAEATAGRIAGAPQRCIDRSSAGGPQIVGDHTLLFTQSGRRLWINTLPASCPSLRRDSTLIVQAFGSQMCQNDQFQPRQPGDVVPGANCRLGTFTPYDRPKR
ncbi:DUF6491 family protein [Sphingomonas qilianensis]|uniref:DUF6491 family protein n=1 Tax=Sphingomonas qilianensis TaxID=1736690 RepID=A0ABU9XQ61_9SPHN